MDTFEIIFTISICIVLFLLFWLYRKHKSEIAETKKVEKQHYEHLNKRIDASISDLQSFKAEYDSQITNIKDQFTSIEDQFRLTEDNNLSSFTEVKNTILKIENLISKLDDDFNHKLLISQKQTDNRFSQVHRYVNEFNISLETMSNENSEKMKAILDLLLSKIEIIKKENDILRAKLEHFSEIKDDSNNLNDFVDVEKENELIKKILEKKKPLDINLVKDDDSLEISKTSEIIESTEQAVETTDLNDEEYSVINDEEGQSDENDGYDVLKYTSISDLHRIITKHIIQRHKVFIKVSSNYSLKEYVGTIQQIKSITKLYPNNKVFYIRFGKHNISATNISDCLIKKDFDAQKKFDLSTEKTEEKIDNVYGQENSVIYKDSEKTEYKMEVADQDIVNKEDSYESGLDSQQEKAYQMMEYTSNNVFVSGKAGTGKSFLLKMFSYGTNKKHLIVAPTGIAALNVNGVTLHSSFGYSNLELGTDIEYIKLKSEKKEVLKQIQVLIIDEISMVRADVLDKVDLILRKLNNSNKPFGGKQVFIFGDLFQLPPIANGSEYEYLQNRYGGVFFFYSFAYKSGDFKYIELNKNHRQNEDHNFFRILNNIREGKINTQDIDSLNSRYSSSSDLRRILKLFPKKDKVERINNEELLKIDAKQYEFYASTEYSRNRNQSRDIENIFPVNINLKLKLGALIMMVKNDVNKRWVNGTLGIISHLSDTVIKVTIDGTEYNVEREIFECKEAKYIDGKIYYETVYSVKQYPLVLAYAITIHKSQGMTYKNVACDLTETFASGQSYVALSRCSSLQGLHLLAKITGKEIETNQEIKSFYKNVQEA